MYSCSRNQILLGEHIGSRSHKRKFATKTFPELSLCIGQMNPSTKKKKDHYKTTKTTTTTRRQEQQDNNNNNYMIRAKKSPLVLRFANSCPTDHANSLSISISDKFRESRVPDGNGDGNAIVNNVRTHQNVGVAVGVLLMLLSCCCCCLVDVVVVLLMLLLLLLLLLLLSSC